MSEEDFDDFAEKAKNLAMDIRAGICPIWQCGGELEYLEDRINWQEPDLRCKNCGALWLLKSRGKQNIKRRVPAKKRITWKNNNPDNKNGEWLAFNDKGEYLGQLIYERVGKHMHWCWYQTRWIRMSPGCLQEVRDKQNLLKKIKQFNAKKIGETQC